jgi:hypothetical protein
MIICTGLPLLARLVLKVCGRCLWQALRCTVLCVHADFADGGNLRGEIYALLRLAVLVLA